MCNHPMSYLCNFRKAVTLWGPEAPRRLPGQSRGYSPFIKKGALPFPPTAGMGVQLEADDEAYVDIEHVYFDVPDQVFICRCKETKCDSEEEYEQKMRELLELGFEKESRHGTRRDKKIVCAKCDKEVTQAELDDKACSECGCLFGL